MIESKYLNTTTKEGRQAQRALVSMLREIRRLLIDNGIDVWCTNRYSYRAEFMGDKLRFELILPRASDAEHERAVEIIATAFPCVAHVKRGLYYFRQIRYGSEGAWLPEEEHAVWAVDGTDMRYEVFEMPIGNDGRTTLH